MTPLTRTFLFLGAMFGALGANGESQHAKAAQVTFDPAASINQLAVDLYKQAARQEGNLFLSPYSISTAFAMVYGGARGETAAQMNRTLHLGGQAATHPAFSNLRKKLSTIQEKGDIQLSIANSLWPQKGYPIRSEYIEKAKEFYEVNVESIDFATDPEGARQRINTWGAQQTNDRIKDLIPKGAIDPLTRLVLANAIYFKADWETKFDPDFTREARPFHLSETETVNVTTMVAFEGLYTSNATFQVLELPYQSKEMSMLILLPHATNGLYELEQTLTVKTLPILKTEFNDNMVVCIPKFSFNHTIDLQTILSDLGMSLPFFKQADFSGMTDKELWLNSAIHEASITVAEKGTEAIAVTNQAGIGGIIKTVFIANHPFLFLIRENSTGTILFIGRVIDPTQ